MATDVEFGEMGRKTLRGLGQIFLENRLLESPTSICYGTLAGGADFQDSGARSLITVPRLEVSISRLPPSSLARVFILANP